MPRTKSVTWNSKPQNCFHCCWLLCLSPAVPLPCHRLLWPTVLSTAREFIPLAEMSQSRRRRRRFNWYISVSVALFQWSLPSTSWSHHPLSSPSIYEPDQVLSLPLPCPGCKSLAIPFEFGFCTFVPCLVITWCLLTYFFTKSNCQVEPKLKNVLH